jgi:16S rRNA (cytosine967-C5)-methyltransferase
MGSSRKSVSSILSLSAFKLTPALINEASLLLAEVLAFSSPADSLISGYFRQHPKLGRQERSAIAECTYGVLRHLLALRWLLPTGHPRLWLLLWLARFHGQSLRELAPLLKPGDQETMLALKSTDLTSAPLAVQAELPDWVTAKLHGTLTDAEILKLGRALQRPAPLDIRVNAVKTSRESLLARLREHGIEAQPLPFSPIGLRLAGHPDLARLAAFKAGELEVQDEGSQLLAVLTGARRGEMIADLCAGAGGKTLALGAAMASSGRLYAFDVNEKRLARLAPRLKRSGLSNVTPQLISHEGDTRLKRLAGKLDRVLVDAPCSGLGTLRRNPDLKFRQSADTVAALTQTQASLIRAGARLLKPGGRLVYATCSLLPEENQGIVQPFLAEFADFRLVPAHEVLASQRIPLDTGTFLQLDPARHGTDGFFAAVLEKSQ